MTGRRVKRLKNYVGKEPFVLIYGDRVSNVNIITDLLKFHQSHGKTIAMFACNAGQRFGVLDIDEQGHIYECSIGNRDGISQSN